MSPAARLEIACFSPEAAMIACNNGADRIELCIDYSAGGLTPAVADLESVLEHSSVPVYAMIRPRSGDFCYTSEEFRQMKKDVQLLKNAGAHGLVWGILSPANVLDENRNAELVDLAGDLPVTFHRAFDVAHDPFETLEQLISLGFSAVLTSGKQSSATMGVNLLQQLIQKANGRIEILPGGGIRSSNIQALHKQLQASFYHSAAITGITQQIDPIEIQQLKQCLL